MLMPDHDARLDSTTLERIVPDEVRAGEATGEDTLRLHLERYQFAARNLVSGSVLDIACGAGYGTALLAENPVSTSATGVDIDEGAVRYATKRYGNQRISYLKSDAMRFSATQPFSNIVSLETIEHVDDPRAVFGHFVGLLAKGGRLIASVPVTPSVDGNPHHKTNFSVRSFQALGQAFSLKALNSFSQVQPYSAWAVATRQETRAAQMRQNLPAFYLSHPSHFALRLWSTVRDGFVNKYLTMVWEK
jgi:SAM-dependent methyltransferase